MRIGFNILVFIYLNTIISCLDYIIRVIKWRKMWWAEHGARMEEIRIAYNILVGKHERRRPLWRPRRRLEDNIRTHLKRNMVERCGVSSSG
jgi:hypothetical protein